MTNLRRFTLSYDRDKEDWALKQEGAQRATKRFGTKGDATAGGALSQALGQEGGSVRIRRQDGVIQEERTFPRARDPKRTPG